jgi:DNA-binding transcriptional ArsR family regulator
MQICSVCQRPEAAEIAAALMSGDSVRAVAERFGLSKSAVHRHLGSCLAAQVAEARREGKRVSAAELVTRLQEVTAETRELLEAAKEKGDLPAALRAIARLEHQLRLEGEFAGELQTAGATVVVFHLETHPEWPPLRSAIVDSLRSFPEARRAVVLAIDTRLRVA